MSRYTLTRRHAVVMSGATLLGAGAGISAFSQDGAAASVNFDVPDASVERQEEIQDVELSVSADVSWQANQPADGFELRLSVGPDMQTLDLLSFKVRSEQIPENGEETLQLVGSLQETDHFSLSDFALPDSGEKTVDVAAKLLFGLRKNGERVVTAEATDTIQLTIQNGVVEAELGISASGRLSVA